MNNDLEQFSEDFLNEMIAGGLSAEPSNREVSALARIALAVKRSAPVGYAVNNVFFRQHMTASLYSCEMKQPIETFYTTPQPAHTEQDGWIKCSDLMPEVDEHKPIAIYTGNCIGQGMFVACYDEDGFYDYWDGVEISGISHWMPLPPPPVATPKPESE